MTRIKDFVAKIWRKILLFFSVIAVALTALAVPLFAADPPGTAIVSGPADGQPAIFGSNVLSVVEDPFKTSFNYKWTSNDTTGGSGTYTKGATTYFPGSGSYAMYSGNFTKFSHTFSDNIGFQISGVLNSPYNIGSLPYYENAERYGVKFAFFFGGGNTSITTANGNVWLTCTLRFFDASDNRLGDVYQLVPVPSLNMFFFQSANLPAFTSQPSYMTLTFSGFGDSSHQLEISPIYFSPLVWSAVKGDPVINTDLDVPPVPGLDDSISDFSNAVTDTNENITAVEDLLSMGGYSTTLNMQDLQPLIRPIQAYSTFLTGWWNLDSTFRVVISFMIGAIVLATFAGIVAGFVRKGKG